MIRGTRPALPAQRWVHEQHQAHDPGRGIVGELTEIELRVDVRQRFAERALQRPERGVAPHAVAVRRAVWIVLLALRAGAAVIGPFRPTERRPAVARTLNVQQPVGQVAVEAVVRVGSAERRGGAEQDGVVVGRRERRGSRARVPEQHHRDVERARHRRRARRRRPGGQRSVQFAEPALPQQQGPGGAHRPRLLAPNAVAPKVEAGHLPAGEPGLLRACPLRHAQHRRQPDEPQPWVCHVARSGRQGEQLRTRGSGILCAPSHSSSRVVPRAP